jgi:hypothetical protein
LRLLLFLYVFIISCSPQPSKNSYAKEIKKLEYQKIIPLHSLPPIYTTQECYSYEIKKSTGKSLNYVSGKLPTLLKSCLEKTNNAQYVRETADISTLNCYISVLSNTEKKTIENLEISLNICSEKEPKTKDVKFKADISALNCRSLVLQNKINYTPGKFKKLLKACN